MAIQTSIHYLPMSSSNGFCIYITVSSTFVDQMWHLDIPQLHPNIISRFHKLRAFQSLLFCYSGTHFSIFISVNWERAEPHLNPVPLLQDLRSAVIFKIPLSISFCLAILTFLTICTNVLELAIGSCTSSCRNHGLGDCVRWAVLAFVKCSIRAHTIIGLQLFIKVIRLV